MTIKANAIGDSITYGVFTGENDECPKSHAEKTWFAQVGEAFGFEIMRNYAVSGVSISSLTSVNPEGAISKKYINMNDDANLIFVAAGTNDYGTNVPLGTIEDKEDVSFYGAVDILCRGIKEKYSEAKLVFVLPINRRGGAPNKRGFALDDYRKAIKEVAGERHGFFIIDGSTFGFEPDDESFRNEYIRDGLHPNDKGHKLYAENVIKKLKEIL